MTPAEHENPWTPEDEGDHEPVLKEWWTTELLFTTKNDHRRWNLMTSFSYEHDTPSCFYQYVLFDITSKKCVLHTDLNDDITMFHHVKNKLDLRYHDSTFSGLYPQYRLHLQQDDKQFLIDAEYHAQSLPHWITQDITHGYLPMGLNCYRYGFLPNIDIRGTLNLQGTPQALEGKAYIEHVWGNWSYKHPFRTLVGVRKTIATYASLSRWWLSHHPLTIPNRIEFSSENNILGYDWVWGVCDNNWSLFYGNSLLWVSEGPSFGALYVTPDGKNYWEFSNVTFKYNSLLYLRDYDIFYPKDFELTGRLKDKTIHLKFFSTTESYVYIDPLTRSRLYNAYILCELPGEMKGSFTDQGKTIPLTGQCKMVPLRQAPRNGHTAVQFKFIKPPQGIGMMVTVDSHHFKKHIAKTVQLSPRPKIRWDISEIDLSKIPEETKKE
ncbi:MAG TPA: hypothetical protein VMT57_09075 [Candidatus Thermoplasmatota archaeon]|nr:hypothetical protein [Candidatus Thermoplasmatota archaeon]